MKWRCWVCGRKFHHANILVTHIDEAHPEESYANVR